jgi:hypothetical protein
MSVYDCETALLTMIKEIVVQGVSHGRDSVAHVGHVLMPGFGDFWVAQHSFDDLCTVSRRV